MHVQLQCSCLHSIHYNCTDKNLREPEKNSMNNHCRAHREFVSSWTKLKQKNVFYLIFLIVQGQEEALATGLLSQYLKNVQSIQVLTDPQVTTFAKPQMSQLFLCTLNALRTRPSESLMSQERCPHSPRGQTATL